PMRRAWPRDSAVPPLRDDRTCAAVGGREGNVERGPRARRAVDVDERVVLPDDSMDGREPETGAFTQLLRGEERLEDAGQVLAGDAAASVGDREAHPVPGVRAAGSRFAVHGHGHVRGEARL